MMRTRACPTMEQPRSSYVSADFPYNLVMGNGFGAESARDPVRSGNCSTRIREEPAPMRILLASATVAGLVLLFGFSAPLAWVVLAMMFVCIVNTRREVRTNDAGQDMAALKGRDQSDKVPSRTSRSSVPATTSTSCR